MSLLPWAIGGAGALLLFSSNARAMKPTPFDRIFEQRCPDVPVEYLQALAKKESNLDPSLVHKRGARGLLQVVDVLRREYNRVTGASVSPEDLLRPAINVRVACFELLRIVASYNRNHRTAFNGRFDWADRRHVELLTMGWNAGWSEKGGTGLVIGMLEDAGFPANDITVDTVVASAKSAGATPVFQQPTRLPFAKKVASQYFRNLRGTAV